MVTIALVRDYERFKIMDINGTHYYWLIWLFWSQKVTKVAIFQTEYLKSQQLARQVHVTKKLDFRLNFIIPGVPDSENWRFLSYPACKIDFLKGFTTVFSLLKKLQSPSRQQCSSHIKITDPQVKHNPQIPWRQIFPPNIGQNELTRYGTLN